MYFRALEKMFVKYRQLMTMHVCSVRLFPVVPNVLVDADKSRVISRFFSADYHNPDNNQLDSVSQSLH